MQFAIRMIGLLPKLADEPLLFIAAAVPTSLLVPATFGVILESPFGAVPFFWCVGLLLAWPREPTPWARRLIRSRSGFRERTSAR
jgi:hypothetical protein